MLNHVYELARSRSHVSELTVEDPAPAFMKLRDALDFATCLKLKVFDNLESKPVVLSGEVLGRLQGSTKLTRGQLELCHEAYWLMNIESSECLNEEAFKIFRLMVKRRLRLQNEAEIAALESKEDRIARLGDIYGIHEIRLRKIVSRATGLAEIIL
jgi:hypothetical protein